MTNKELIQRIYDMPLSLRKSIVKGAMKHTTAQCNGDYWYEEDKGEWSDLIGKRLERRLIREVMTLCGTKNIPSWLSWDNDPRGIVVKIEADKLTEEEKQLCRDLRLNMDWGGDFSILTESEFKSIFQE